MSLLLRKKPQMMEQQNQKQQLQRNQQKNKKLDNKGMTLIEVIVAMTLLTIVIVPVLQSITASMYYNTKARNRQNVTLEVETIMETFKGYDLKSLKDMFDSSSIPSIDAAGFTAPTDMDADELEFLIDDMKTENGKLYDVKVKATKTVKIENVLEIGNADGEKDAIFRGDMKYNDDAWTVAKDDFVANYLNGSTGFLAEINAIDTREGDDELTEADFEAESSKLTLHNKETRYIFRQDGGENIAEVKIVYQYYIKDFPYYIDLNGDGLLDDATELFSFSYPAVDTDGDKNYDKITHYLEVEMPLDPEDEFFYKLTTAANLGRAFIFYYPQYEDVEENETIKIDNQTSIPLEFYLLKQKLQGKNDAFIESRESGYKPKVSCESGSVTLFHNLKYNIVADTPNLPMPSGVSEGTFSAVVDYTNDTNPDGLEANIIRKNKALVYNLVIEVSDVLTGNVVTELNGTMIEKDKEYS